MTTPKAISFLNAAREPIKEFIARAGFADANAIVDAVIWAIDALQEYTEEGKHLYPEVVVTTSIEGLTKPLAYHNLVVVGEEPLKSVFPRALKICAPLATDDWAIWIEINGDNARFGLVDGVASELSPTLQNQLVGELAIRDGGGTPVVYMRSVGTRKVELQSKDEGLSIPAGLAELSSDEDELLRFVEHLIKDVPEGRRTVARGFFLKVIGDAIRATHGCMLAVVPRESTAVEKTKTKLPDGVYFDPPINFMGLLRESDELRSRESSTKVRAFVTLLRGMISQDGITMFSTDGNVVGYNLFVAVSGSAPVAGGARKRALEALHLLGICSCVLSFSHDGALSFKEG